MFFNQENIWNWGVKTDFENFDHLVVLNSRFALVITVFPKFQKLRLRRNMVFNEEYEFYFHKFITLLLKNLIFRPSEAPLNGLAKFKEIACLPLLSTYKATVVQKTNWTLVLWVWRFGCFDHLPERILALMISHLKALNVSFNLKYQTLQKL